MRINLRSKISDPFIIILLVIVSLVCLINYVPGTYLLGWDSLQVELNPLMNLRRNIFSVWEEYQGLGLLAGNGHAVEALRSLLIYILTIFIPQSFVRYFYHFLCILFGVFFTYKFLKTLGFSRYGSFIGGFFYFFNIGTMQNFYVPFEPFSAFYAFLPMTLMYYYKTLKGKIKIVHITISLMLLTFAFQVPTNFVVFGILLVVVTIGHFLGNIQILLKSKKLFIYFRNIFIYGIITLIVNSFWLLPFIYFVLNNSSIRFESLSTRLSTENVILQNLAYANIWDIFLLRSFWYSNIDYLPSQQSYGYMLTPWIQWIANPAVLYLGYSIATLIIVGIIYSIATRQKHITFTLPILIISLFFLFGKEGFTGWLYQEFVNIFPMIGEAFRFSFTKWVVPTIFVGAIFFSQFFEIVLIVANQFIRQNFLRKYSKVSFLVIFSLALVIYMFPYLSGNLFYNNVKVDFPVQYNTLFTELKKPEYKDKRIAIFPVNNIWGWYFNYWGYRGSGYLWYGIEQPMLSRTFDVWNKKNEEFYNEIHYAVYSENSELLAFVLEKYQVDYLLIDHSIYSPDAPNAPYLIETEKLFEETDNIRKVFVENDLTLYQYDTKDQISSFVYAPSEYDMVSDNIKPSQIDSMFFRQNTNYLITNNYSNSIYFPLQDEQIMFGIKDQKWIIDGQKNANTSKFIIDNEISSQRSSRVYDATLLDDRLLLTQRAYLISDSNNNLLNPNIPSAEIIFNPGEYKFFLGEKIELQKGSKYEGILVPSNSELILTEAIPSMSYDLSKKVNSSEIGNCGEGAKSIEAFPGSVKITSKSSATCLDFSEEITVAERSILKISFEFKTESVGVLSYCFIDSESGGCINNKYKNLPGQTINWKAYTGITEIIKDQSANLRFFVEGEGDDTKSATLKNIIVETYPIVDKFEVPNFGTNVSSIDLSNSTNFPITISGEDYHRVNSYIPGDSSFNPTTQNCDNFSQNIYERKLTKDPLSFEYYSVGAISCDDVKDTNIDINYDYVISFDSANLQGKPLDVCVYSTRFQKCLIQDRLQGSGSETFILPKYPAGGNIGINIRNQSIGKIPTQNALYSISAGLVDYEKLKGIHFENDNYSKRQNSIQVSLVNHPNPSTYNITLDRNNIESTGLLVLNQSHHQGWIIYEKGKCGVMEYLNPLFCKEKEIPHYLAKGWANAWEIPKDKSEGEFVIVFWPQWLQFYGFGMLIIYLIGIGTYLYIRNTRKLKLVRKK